MIEIADKVSGIEHSVDEQALRARVRGWMWIESAGEDYWLGTHTAEGNWIFCSSQRDRWQPSEKRRAYAIGVVRHMNALCSDGGAWLGGWRFGGMQFYLLWKDAQGDIQIPIECDKPWIVIREWAPSAWEKHAATALMVWKRFHENIEYGPGQTKQVALGEKIELH